MPQKRLLSIAFVVFGVVASSVPSGWAQTAGASQAAATGQTQTAAVRRHHRVVRRPAGTGARQTLPMETPPASSGPTAQQQQTAQQQHAADQRLLQQQQAQSDHDAQITDRQVKTVQKQQDAVQNERRIEDNPNATTQPAAPPIVPAPAAEPATPPQPASPSTPPGNPPQASSSSSPSSGSNYPVNDRIHDDPGPQPADTSRTPPPGRD